MNTALAGASAHGAPTIIEGHRFTPVNEASAYACYWEAMDIVDRRFALGQRSMFRIPGHWTAQLLMHKAGVPREFIAVAFKEDQDRIRRRLCVLIGLMIFAPYAAEIEMLMKSMPSYTDMRLNYEAIEEQDHPFTDGLDDEN